MALSTQQDQTRSCHVQGSTLKFNMTVSCQLVLSHQGVESNDNYSRSCEFFIVALHFFATQQKIYWQTDSKHSARPRQSDVLYANKTDPEWMGPALTATVAN